MTRKYRMTPEGEKPVWASRRKLEEMGEREPRTNPHEAHERFMATLRAMTPDEVLTPAQAAGILDEHGQLCWPYREGDEVPAAS